MNLHAVSSTKRWITSFIFFLCVWVEQAFCASGQFAFALRGQTIKKSIWREKYCRQLKIISQKTICILAISVSASLHLYLTNLRVTFCSPFNSYYVVSFYNITFLL